MRSSRDEESSSVQVLHRLQAVGRSDVLNCDLARSLGREDEGRRRPALEGEGSAQIDDNAQTILSQPVFSDADFASLMHTRVGIEEKQSLDRG